VNEDGGPRRIPFRGIVPNAVTILALCSGLSGVYFAIGREWEKALAAIVIAGVLDGMDGRIARLLRAQSKFGAELDSLSDNIAFGTAPALILFLWSLHDAPKFGWTAAPARFVWPASTRGSMPPSSPTNRPGSTPASRLRPALASPSFRSSCGW
jgi:phosphatidylserine synthase